MSYFTVSRRSFLALPGALALAGCGDRSDGDARMRPLRVAMMAMPPGLGNPYTAAGTPSTNIWHAVFDGLTKIDRDFQLAPGLAVEWRVLDDQTRWEFKLRPNVKFSNGAPFTADAVVKAINYLFTLEGKGTVIGGELRSVKGAEKIDDLTVVVITHKPDAILPQRMTSLLIPEPGQWASLGPAGFAEKPIGTGPYELVTWRDGNGQVHLRKNPSSWRSTTIEEIFFVPVGDAAARAQALLAGSVDIGPVDMGNVSTYTDRGIKMISTPAMQGIALAFITERKNPPGPVPLQDVRVRQALNYAVNKQGIVDSVLNGFGAPIGQPASRVTPGYDPAVEPYPYDPAKAKAMLAEAGYPNGFPLKIIITGDGLAPVIYQSMANDLRNVGIDVRLEAMAFALWLRTYVAHDWAPDVDAFGLSWTTSPYNDVIRPMEYYSCSRPNAFFCDKPLAEKMQRASAIMDGDERIAFLKELARDYHEAAPSLYLVDLEFQTGFSPTLENGYLVNRVPFYDDLRWKAQS
jgi:peptide/nickel transport system substrate-binding protein